MSQVYQTLFEEHEDILPNRWITLEEQKEWCEFLSGLNFNTTKLEWCASEWEKYQCSVTHSHSKKVHYLNCGKRGLCPRCSMSYARKRASIMYKYIKDNIATRLDFDLKLNQITLTLPQQLHDMDQKLFAKMIKKFMKEFDIDSYGYSIQNRHSKDPLSGKYVHAHLLSLNMRKIDNQMVKSEYFFDLDLMRDTWKKIVQEDCDIEIDGNVNLHSEYASVLNEPWKVLHNFAYLYRYPIQDLFNEQVRNHSTNYVQNDAIRKTIAVKVRELVEEKKPRLVWCGMLTSTKRKELIKTMLTITVQSSMEIKEESESNISNTILHFEQPNYHWKSMKEVEKEIDIRSKECRDCGSPFEPEPFERGSYDGNNEPQIISYGGE